WLNEAITFLHAVKFHFARHHRVRPFIKLSTAYSKSSRFAVLRCLEGSDRATKGIHSAHTAFMLHYGHLALDKRTRFRGSSSAQASAVHGPCRSPDAMH